MVDYIHSYGESVWQKKKPKQNKKDEYLLKVVSIDIEKMKKKNMLINWNYKADRFLFKIVIKTDNIVSDDILFSQEYLI